MMHPGVDYYSLLGVTSTAAPDEITRAYRKKILEVHLDKINPGQDSDLCYKTIEAYRILSDRRLRTKYDIQRNPSYKAKEKFVPAGYICYDVGHSQLSKRVLKSISEWKEEFDSLSNTAGISDNYFECFSSLMGQVLELEEQGCAQALKDKEEEYCCPVCDKKFASETLHWDQVIHPYITMFSGESCNNHEYGHIGPLLTYFEKLLGARNFNWEPRSYPTSVLGIWGSQEWKKLDNCDVIMARILHTLPQDEEFADIDEMIDYIGETFLSDSETDPHLYPDHACYTLIFILENQDDQSTVVNRVQECLFKDDIRQILYLVSAMKNYLGCDQAEWLDLAKEAVESEQPEVAMLWTKVAVEFTEDEDNEALDGIWYNLGMKISNLDPILAHFCFLLQGYGNDEETAYEDWNDLGDDFCERGEHQTAIEYYIYGNLNAKKKSQNNNDSETEEEGNDFLKLMQTSKAQVKKGDRQAASFYRGIYYSLKVKGLLAKLQRRKKDDAGSELDPELEEVVDLIDNLDHTNPLEGYKLIATVWPKAFESPVCQGIHKGTIRFLRRGKMTTAAFNLILAALHFLPDEDKEDEEEFEELQKELSKECNTMVVRQIQNCMKTSDFKTLGDVLDFLSNAAESRCLPGVRKVLENMGQEVVDKSPHLRAMKFLIEGTIAKIQKEWITAMNLYQSALLSSPECMHRVLPCISKLSQDIEFHEAILSQVHSEVKELKEYFDGEEYPEVETFGTRNNRNSLVIGDVAPRTDFGYKNSISKIQPDPDTFANQPPPEDLENNETPPVETNTPLVTLDKTEEAIGSGKNQGQLNAALSYIDLLKALPMPFQPGPIVMAASHLLKAMDETKDAGSLFAYRNAIMQLAENLLKIDRKTQASIQHGLTHKHMLSVLLSAHEKLSKAVRRKMSTDETEQSEDSESSSSDQSDMEESESLKCKTKRNRKASQDENGGPRRCKSENDIHKEHFMEDEESKEPQKLQRSKSMNRKPGMDLIKTSDAHLISRFLKNVVDFPKIEPLANIPTLNCSDLVYVETLGNSFLSQFCNEKVGQKHQSRKIPKHLHAYIHFVEVWKGRSQLTDFQTAKLKAMKELLALKGWSFTDVEQLLGFPILNLTDDGWSSEYRTELLFPNPQKAFKSIHGFKIDYKSGRISFLLTKDKQTAFTCGNLFDSNDIQEIFTNGIEPKDCVLSLDSPDPNLRSHPFKEAKFSTSSRACKSFHVPNLYRTLSRVAILLCSLCSGLEVCATSPFNMKPSDEGLLLRLEEHLQHLLRPAKARKDEEESKIKQPELDIPNRFWLNLVEVFEEEEEDEISSTFTYKVGDVKAHVKMNTLILTLTGTNVSLTPEAEFARDFTKHYDEIGQFYPEFLRLKELVKLTVICRKLKQVLRDKVALLKQNGRGREDQMRIACVCKSIRELGIYLEEEEEDKSKTVAKNFTTCTWVPATFCNNLNPEIYEVSAGVRINPDITYFPVSLPSDYRLFNARDLLAKKKLSFIRKN